MRVKRDFDRIYREQADPWGIGAADDPRYDLYRELLLGRVRGGVLLDVGCGLGAFLARFAGDFDELVGVETAGAAVRRARELHPEIEFVHAVAERLAESPLDARAFEAIVASDVLYYLHRRDRARVVSWIARHLAPDGHALVAAWCPGGRYFEPDELRALVRSALRIVDDVVLPSEHVALVCRRRRRLAAFSPTSIDGATVVGDAASATRAFPREPTPEQLRRRKRLERWRLRPPSAPDGDDGDQLLVIVGEPSVDAVAALERAGFEVVSPDVLAAAVAQSAGGGRC
jgi:SAM-dependent methyltransferase